MRRAQPQAYADDGLNWKKQNFQFKATPMKDTLHNLKALINKLS